MQEFYEKKTDFFLKRKLFLVLYVRSSLLCSFLNKSKLFFVQKPFAENEMNLGFLSNS